MQNSILLVFMLVVLSFFLKSMQYVGNEPITLHTHLPQRPVYASVLDLSSTSVYRGICHIDYNALSCYRQLEFCRVHSPRWHRSSNVSFFIWLWT